MAGKLFILIVSILSCSAQTTVRLSIVGNDESAVKVYTGQSMQMECRAENVPLGMMVSHYFWTRDDDQNLSTVEGIVLQGQSMIIRSMRYLVHLGDYQCGAVLSNGETFTSNLIVLTPKFLAVDAFRRRVTVIENATAMLECIVFVPANDASATVMWSREDEVISSHSPGNSILTIENAQLADAGAYECSAVTLISGQHSVTVTLVVVAAPTWITPWQVSSSQAYELGETGTFRCGPVHSVVDATFQWGKNGEILRPGHFQDRVHFFNPPNYQTSADPNYRSNILRIRDMNYADAAQYDCIVSNIAGTIGKTFNVTVTGQPILTLSHHAVITAPVHSLVTLHCPYQANPAATDIQWYTSTAFVLNSTRHTLFYNGTLRIRDAVLSDSRNYSCTITNGLGYSRRYQTLLVIDFPRMPDSLQAKPNSPYSALLTWTLPPEEANRPVAKYNVMLMRGKAVIMNTALPVTSQRFELMGLLPGQNYSAILQAVNMAGRSNATVTFRQPITAPSLIFNVSALRDGYSLLAKWHLETNGGSAITNFVIKVYKNDTEDYSLVYAVQPAISASNYTLTDLEPATDYLLQISIGNGYFSSNTSSNMELAISTAAAPPSRPSTPQITSTTTHVIKITFTVGEGSYPISSFLLNTTRSSADGGPATTQNRIAIEDSLYVESVVELQGEEKQVVMSIGGLHQLTYYTFEVAAVSEAGVGKFSDPSKPAVLEDGRILYYIVFGVVGGAIIAIIVIISVAVVTLRTSKRIQRTKRTLSINGHGDHKETESGFTNHHSERRNSNHSFQLSSLNGLHECITLVGTPVSSVSDYKHHTLSSSTNGVHPLYDKLSEYRKRSVSSDYDKHTGSLSSDGQADSSDQSDQAISHADLSVQKVDRSDSVFQGVTIDVYGSRGRILDLNMPDNGASATGRQVFASTGKISSAYSISPEAHPQKSSHLPSSSLHQLTVHPYGSQHLLSPSMGHMAKMDSSPTINYRCSHESILDTPTNYMTDV